MLCVLILLYQYYANASWSLVIQVLLYLSPANLRFSSNIVPLISSVVTQLEKPADAPAGYAQDPDWYMLYMCPHAATYVFSYSKSLLMRRQDMSKPPPLPGTLPATDR